MALTRTVRVFAAGVLQEEYQQSYTWDDVRNERNRELNDSDWRFMSDNSPSDEWVAYRTFLRDLPQNFGDADTACDAWEDYDKPEGA